MELPERFDRSSNGAVGGLPARRRVSSRMRTSCEEAVYLSRERAQGDRRYLWIAEFPAFRLGQEFEGRTRISGGISSGR